MAQCPSLWPGGGLSEKSKLHDIYWRSSISVEESAISVVSLNKQENADRYRMSQATQDYKSISPGKCTGHVRERFYNLVSGTHYKQCC